MENYNEKIAILLKKMGVSPALLGYKYITEALKMALEDDTVLYSVTKRLYPTIAKKFNTTTSRTERAIRHSIERAFDNMPTDIQTAVFGNTVSYNKGKATNTEFIATLAELITTESNNPIWNM